MQGYCLKCKAKVVMTDIQTTKSVNGVWIAKGQCPACGTKVSRLLGKNYKPAGEKGEGAEQPPNSNPPPPNPPNNPHPQVLVPPVVIEEPQVDITHHPQQPTAAPVQQQDPIIQPQPTPVITKKKWGEKFTLFSVFKRRRPKAEQLLQGKKKRLQLSFISKILHKPEQFEPPSRVIQTKVINKDYDHEDVRYI